VLEPLVGVTPVDAQSATQLMAAMRSTVLATPLAKLSRSSRLTISLSQQALARN